MESAKIDERRIIQAPKAPLIPPSAFTLSMLKSFCLVLRRRGLLRAGSRGGGSLVVTAAVLRAAAATLALAAVLLLQT